MVALLTPWALALVRQLQCVPAASWVCGVAATMAATFSAGMVRLRPPPRRHLPQRLGALLEETPPPQGHRLGIGSQTRRDGLVLLALRGRQNNAAAERNLLRGAMGANPALQLQLIGCT